MNELSATLQTLTTLALKPFVGWSPLIPLVLWAAALGVVMAVVFRFTSPQARLKRIADLSRAEVLAIRLFKDEPGVMFRALGRLMRHTVVRLWYSLPPVLVMAIPFTLLLAHLAVWYERRPLTVGESAVVELELYDAAWTTYRDVSLTTPDGVASEIEPLHDGLVRAIDWRVRGATPVRGDLLWQLGSAQATKEIVVAESTETLCPVSARRAGPGFWDRLLHPGEPALSADCPACGIHVDYPMRSTPVFTWKVPWWCTLIVVSMISALLVRPIVKVQF